MSDNRPQPDEEVVSWDVAATLRERSPAEKFEMVCSMWRFARDLSEAGVRMQHPTWDSTAVHHEVARRLAVGSR